VNSANYRPDVFEVTSVEHAKAIIVTPVPGASTEERWVKETEFLVSDIANRLGISSQSCVLDYGCGIGRISKGLIEATGCRVIGVDFSNSMRLMAPEYVLSGRFTAWSPETLDTMFVKGFRVDAAISIWVIQHVLNATEVIARIHRAIKPGGLHYSVNVPVRCVPTDAGWISDGFDVREGLRQVFAEEAFYQLPAQATTPEVAAASMVQVLRKSK